MIQPGPSNASVDQLAAELAALKKRLRTLSRKPQLAHSAIDDGALVTTVGGQLGQVIGQQWDGTSGSVVVGGPTPPVPGAPVMTTVLGGVSIRVTGEFEQDATADRPTVAPMDFARFEVEVCDQPEFVSNILRAGVTSASGGSITLAWNPVGTPLYARVRARSLSGKVSAPSLTAGPVESGPVGLTDLGFDIAEYAGGNTIYYGAADPTPERSSGFVTGDLWLKEVGTSAGGSGQPPAGTKLYETYRWNGLVWSRTEAQGISQALANALAASQLAASKATPYYQTSAPTGLASTAVAVWYDTDDGNRPYQWSGTAWVSRQLGNGSIQPQSLVASNVIATGTVTAALLEALLILATTIIAGDPNGDHARMTPTGFRVYKANALTGVPDEVVRMGTDTNDYFAVVNANGDLVASIDDTGRASFSALDVQGQVRVGGVDLINLVGSGPRGVVGRFGPATQPEIQFWDRVGIARVGVVLEAGRAYSVSFRATYRTFSDGDEVRFKLHWTNGNAGDTISSPPAPTVTSPQFATFLDSAIMAGRWFGVNGDAMFYPTTTTRYWILLTVERGKPDTLANGWIPEDPIEIVVRDEGVAPAISGGFTLAGGTNRVTGTPPPPPPPTTQNYFQDLAPVGRASFEGNGNRMTWAGNDVYQGYNGTNGDTRGQFWFDLPVITGTVTRVDLWLYFRHWWFNSGGTVVLNISDQRGIGPNPYKFRGDWLVGGYPKPGGKEVQLPADWYPFFRGTDNNNYNGRATCITLGPGGGTNQLYYGVATDARLRIHYTQ